MKRFLNARETIVTEAIDGLLSSSGGKLARLDGYPHIKVVVRRNWDKRKVAVVSGGGAGHEPAHAGFVGAGTFGQLQGMFNLFAEHEAVELKLAAAVRADPHMLDVPIIGLSSLVSAAAVERGRQVGLYDYVAKFDRQGLIAALKQASLQWVEAA